MNHNIGSERSSEYNLNNKEGLNGAKASIRFLADIGVVANT